MEKIIKNYNFTNTKTNLFLLESLKSKIPLSIFEQFISEIAATSVPDFTLLNCEKIISTFNSFDLNKSEYKILIKIASFSPFLVNIILKNNNYFFQLFENNNLNKVKSKSDFFYELEKMCNNCRNISEFKKLLRKYKQKEFLRIGVQDICKIMSVEKIMFQLSELAAVFLDFSIKWLCKNNFKNITQDTIIVFGMGKLAGRELNFSSDIDLVYFYNNENKRFHQIYIHFFETLTKLINDITEDGFVFRVDLRLRPDGINGPIAMNIENAIFYYENFGRLWERGVLLKATPIAGNIKEGEKLLDNLKSFIYRRHLDFRVTEEIFQMKQKINQSIKQEDSLNNIKLGIGGIREIEFIIQAIQLVFGGKYIDIREKNSLHFLKIIKKYNFLDNEDIDFLIFSYKFLRNLEHKIQIIYEKQTHSLPKNELELKVIADYFGFKKVEPFLDYQFSIRKKVHNIFNKFIMFKNIDLNREEISSFIEINNKDEFLKVFTKYNLSEQTGNMLFEFFNYLPEETESKIINIFSHILKTLHKFQNIDSILINFVNLLEKLKFNSGYISFLLKNKVVIEVLMNIFSKSRYLSNTVLKYREIFEEVFFTDFFKIKKDREDFFKEVDVVVNNALTYEDILENLRIYKQKEHLRIGLHFLNNQLDIVDVLKQLTLVADILFSKSVDIVKREFEKRFSTIDTDFTIIALGKFGSRELNFSSDLDIILLIEKDVVSKKGLSSIEYFSRFLQRLISFISVRTKNGIMYEVDTRLRPSGNSGTLVTTFDSFVEYHNKSSAVWELQALLKARDVAGEKCFAEKTLSFIKKVIKEKNFGKEEIKEILRIRKRIEIEEAKESEKLIDIKNGAGGIIDVEFLVQILLLKNKIIYNNGNTFDNLLKLKKENILKEKDFEILYENYHYLRTIENIVRLQSDTHSDKIDIENNLLFDNNELKKIINIKIKNREIFKKLTEA